MSSFGYDKNEVRPHTATEIILIILVIIMFFVGYKVGYYKGCAASGFEGNCYEESYKNYDPALAPGEPPPF